MEQSPLKINDIFTTLLEKWNIFHFCCIKAIKKRQFKIKGKPEENHVDKHQYNAAG
jgi:hypothetical protein